ncbi:MAG: hypothetical protein ACFFAE_00530 [Candidatus Hodarchaeota archaeon]
MSISRKARIGIMLLIGLPSLLGIGVLAATQLNLIAVTDDLGGVQQVILDRSLFDDAPRDDVEFAEISFNGDILTIGFTYTGGLSSHVFELIGSGDFAESAPIQTTLVLSHDAQGDSGEALISKELNFDLKPLKEAFLQAYSFYAPPDTLLIQLESYGEITYHL